MSDKNKFQPSKKLVKADGTIAWVWEGKLGTIWKKQL
jgi:plastocyanin